MRRNSVDFPDPFPPITAVLLPAGIRQLTESSASFRADLFLSATLTVTRSSDNAIRRGGAVIARTLSRIAGSVSIIRASRSAHATVRPSRPVW